MRHILFTLALLLPSIAQAQLAFWIPTNGDQGIGIAIGTNGQVVTFTRLITINPGPQPEPLPVSGLYVLGVIDSVTHAKQLGIMQAKEIHDLLEANCAKDSAGALAYRWFAPSSDLSRELPIWQDAMKTPHDGINPPYWIVSNGKQKWIESWPKDVAAAKARLEEAIRGMK
jgi:hypothetical protein